MFQKWFRKLRAALTATRVWFLARSRWIQILIGIVVLALVVGIVMLLRGSNGSTNANSTPTVTIQAVNSFGGTSSGVYVDGVVQSVSQADLLAQSAGTVTAVHAKLGQSVPAGYVIADLDSAAASAAVLQAQGAYDAAVAAQRATNLQAQNSAGSLSEQQISVRTTYQTDYTTAANVLATDVDVFFGDNTAVGPSLLISPLGTSDTLSRERRTVGYTMDSWQSSLSSANTTDPLTLLSDAEQNLNQIASFLSDLHQTAVAQGSGATATQLSDLATAQSSINTLLAGISTARTAYNNAVTAANVAQTESGTGQGVTSSDASVEQALGSLRAAQAAYEKTVIRAPIAGTVNYLNIHVGDYIGLNQRVATVARNNALQVQLELSQTDAERVAVGDTVTIDNTYKGTVTAIAPALDPVTKQIEVDIAVEADATLVNGQSVQVALPALTAADTTTAASSTAATTTAAVQLPLTAVKLLPNERDVFTVDASGHLVAHLVTIGDVIGDRIEITSPLPADLQIVVDARGLSAGDKVQIASSTSH